MAIGSRAGNRKFGNILYSYSSSGLRKFVEPEAKKLEKSGYRVKVVTASKAKSKGDDYVRMYVDWEHRKCPHCGRYINVKSWK